MPGEVTAQQRKRPITRTRDDSLERGSGAQARSLTSRGQKEQKKEEMGGKSKTKRCNPALSHRCEKR